jgi:aminoglycoside phosphotransferase family enzyme
MDCTASSGDVVEPPSIATTVELDAILADLLDQFEHSRAHPHAADAPRLVQTHASAVVLAGDEVFKFKKPVDFGFLDYSTLAKRRAMCEAEVELNRRLAPDVYLGVVPITCEGGRAVVGGRGEPIEYAVHMRRLPEDATLGARLERGPLDDALMTRIAHTIAAFHTRARRGPDVTRWATFECVRANCRDNFEGLAPHAGDVAQVGELERLAAATEAELERLRARIERRAQNGVPCETHGDLRLEHVYVFAGGSLSIVDCVEFSPRYSCADPVADIAFLAMDLRAHGAAAAARTLLDAYFAASGDDEGRALVPLYVAYRSTVRAKVRALHAAAPSIPAEQRAEALELARAHLRLAADELAPHGPARE